VNLGKISPKNVNAALFGGQIQSNEVDKLLSLVKIPSGSKVLEIGCGKGKALACLGEKLRGSGVELWGIDVCPADIEDGRRLLEEEGVKAAVSCRDAAQLPFPDGYFDLAYGLAALHHIPDWPQAIAEAFRVLKDGGRYFLVENTRPFFRLPLVKKLDHACSIFTKDELLQALEEKGFAVLMWEQRGFYKHILHGSVRVLAKKPELYSRGIPSAVNMPFSPK